MTKDQRPSCQDILNRRKFLKSGAAATVGVAAASMPLPALASGTKRLRMVTSWPKNYPGLGMMAKRFGKRLEQVSGGRYKVKLYAGGELVSPVKCLDAVQEGTAHMYHSAEYYYRGKDEGFGFMTSVPFGLRADEMDAWVQHGGGQKLWDQLSAQFGVKALACGNTGSQMGGWFRKPVKTLEDFKGLKMRIPGLGGLVLNELGGSAQLLGGKDILPALQAGTIDATEWVGPWNDMAFGFYKILKHYHFPGFHEPGPTLSLGISKKFWDSLSRDDKELFNVCALAENNYSLAEYNAKNSAALKVLVEKHGVQLHEFSDDIYKAIGAASKDVVAKAGASSAISKKIYASYSDFRKTALDWSSRSDESYMNKRRLVKF